MRQGVHARLGPIDAWRRRLMISGDSDKYRFNINGRDILLLEGHFFVSCCHMAQGHKFYKLVAIFIGEMANLVFGHQ